MTILLLACGSENGSRIYHSPRNLLKHLEKRTDLIYIPISQDSIPIDWISEQEVQFLVDNLFSTVETAPVISMNLDIDFRRLPRTTRGVECLFILDSYLQQKRFPHRMMSSEFGKPLNGVFVPDSTLVQAAFERLEIRRTY